MSYADELIRKLKSDAGREQLRYLYGDEALTLKAQTERYASLIRHHEELFGDRKDVQLINSDPDVHSVIYYKNNCCKIATKKEARICADRILKAGCAQMRRYWNIIDKARMEGQMKLETREDLQNLLESV